MEFLSMEYYKNFKCIGSKCEDHCCKDWAITIDKKTFENYKKLKKTNFSNKLNSSITRNRKSTCDNSYGKFKLNNGVCPMLSEDRLCEIYLNIGERNMCNTCKTYPRTYNKVNNRIEASLTLSCIEVAKNILLSKECIEFSLENRNISNIKFNNEINKNKTKSYVVNDFDEIRSFCISLIQERKYTIEERLAVLGLFIKNLSEINDSNLVNDLIQDYQNRINNNIYHGILNKLGLENLIGVQNQFCTEIYNVILSKGISDNRFIDKFDKAIEYLKLNESNIKQREEVLNKSLQNEYSDFISEYKYIYENYLVSYIFNSLFPVSNMSLNDTYNDLIIRFSLIKITLIGLCGYYKSEMKVDYAVDFIQSFVKVVEHNVTIVEKLKKFLNENNINSLAHMMVMIGK